MSDLKRFEDIHQKFGRVLEINEAIAEALYSDEVAGLPAYLDLDNEALDEVAQRLSASSGEVGSLVTAAVKDVIADTPTKTNQFSRFRLANDEWLRGDTFMPPPALALLAVFSLAAERMQRSSEMGANNYYGRLDEVLGLGGKSNAEKSYREVCDELWASLVRWLDEWEGERGLPTVPSTSSDGAQPYEYVNKAISQALLRDVDRTSLLKIFEAAGLEPQQDMDAEDMAGYLDEGLPIHGTQHLKKLWKKGDLRMAIAQAAVGSLRIWTGTTTSERPERVKVRLVAVIQKFFGQRLDLNLDVPHPDYRAARVLRLTTSEESLEDLEFFPSGRRSLRLLDSNVLASDSLIDGRLKLVDPETGMEALRVPRGVVPLRHDESTQVFIEADRMMLGVPHVILARRDAVHGLKSYPIADQVAEVLSNYARSGWSVVESIPGLPEGWVLFLDVELMGVPDLSNRNFALRALEPVSTTSIVLTGGIQIPGAIRKWSSLRPPLVTVLNDVESSGGSLTVFRESDDQPVMIFQVTGAAGVIDLASLDLTDGNYRLELTIEDVKRSGKMVLRSSFSPSLRPLDELAYPIGTSPLGMLSAETRADVETDSVVGSLLATTNLNDISTEYRLPTEPWWSDVAKLAAGRAIAQVEQASNQIRITSPDPNSCAVTGAHVIKDYPVWTGRVTTKFITGVCEGCGLTRRDPARPKNTSRMNSKGPKASSATRQSPKLDLKRIAAISATEEPDWDVIFDVLCHLGSGSIADLGRLATQVEGTLLATDKLVRGLEVLGHIDVHLNPTTMRPDRWSCAPASISFSGDRLAFLVGRRNPRLIEQFAEVADRNGARLERLGNRNLPTTIRVSSESPMSPSMFEALVDPRTGAPLAVATEPSRRIAAHLSTVSSMADGLSVVPLPAHRKVERWDSSSTTWVEAEDSEMPGAYKFSGYGVVYGLRRTMDVASKKIRVCTVQLLKHIVAQSEGSTLLAYRPDERALITRLGADLPGLYGRAAVLCSGLAPNEDTQQRALVYSGVSADVAALIGKAVAS